MRPIYTLIFLFALSLVSTVNAQQIDWVTPIQSVNNETGTAITTNKHGYIYHAGDLNGSITFGEGGPDEVTVSGRNYVARYTSDGLFDWVATIQSDGSPLNIYDIGVDNAGNVYIAGQMEFGNNITFGAGEATETTISTNGNSSDVFVASFDKRGGFEWVRQGGLGEDNGARAIAVAGNGDSYTVGFYRSHIIFGEEGKTEAVDLFSEGGELDNDVFIVKFNKKGDVLWAKSAGGAAGADIGFDVVLDGNQDLYLSGHFISSATFGKDTPEEVTISSDGTLDGFVARITKAGDPVWALQLGGSGLEQARSLDIDNGVLAVVGTFTAPFDLASTDGSSVSIPVVLADNIFLGRYDTNGVLDNGGAIYLDDFPTGSSLDLAFGENQQYCVMGNFIGTGIFGIGQDGITVLESMDPDMFMACYSVQGILEWADSDPASINAGTVSGNGDVIVTGGFQGTTVFGPGDPGETTIDSDGMNDIFLASFQNLSLEAAAAAPESAMNRSGALHASIDGFRLHTNYPNPFNPATTIRVTLPEAAPVSLIVYDTLGREVSRLLDGEQGAGVHDVVFSAGDLPSGLYLYRLETPAGVLSRTMLLLK